MILHRSAAFAQHKENKDIYIVPGLMEGRKRNDRGRALMGYTLETI